MPKLVVVDVDGSEKVLEGESGLSVMEVIRDAGYDSLAAICGGCCSCATCHVFVDQNWTDNLPEQEEDEKDLVSETESYDAAASRLSCQIPFSDELDGLKVTIAPAD